MISDKSIRLFRNLSNQSNFVHFGFKTIPEEDKEPLVSQVFSNVADNYDMMNDAMSGGLHRVWKRNFIRKLYPTKNMKVLDVAGGTGDIAFRFLERLKQARQDLGTAHVTVVDVNSSMLKVGQRKAEELGYSKEGRVSFMEGNAEHLPIEDNSIDVYTIAFGIRNCTHVDRVVQEAYRVLRPGGRFMCLEFSHVENPILRKLYRSYSFNVIPDMGHILAGDRDSYRYLVESIQQFPKQQEFASLIERCGFQHVIYENQTFGVVAIHSGYKS